MARHERPLTKFAKSLKGKGWMCQCHRIVSPSMLCCFRPSRSGSQSWSPSWGQWGQRRLTPETASRSASGVSPKNRQIDFRERGASGIEAAEAGFEAPAQDWGRYYQVQWQWRIENGNIPTKAASFVARWTYWPNVLWKIANICHSDWE